MTSDALPKPNNLPTGDAVDAPSKRRSAALDLVRVLAVVAVVIGHTRPERTATMLTFSWHVPVFFVLTGYLLSSHRDAATELRHRWRTVLIPTLVWGAIVTAAWVVHTMAVGAPAGRHFLRQLLWGGLNLNAPYSAFWFMPVLVMAVVLLRLLDAIDRRLALAVGAGGYLLSFVFPHQVATSYWSVLLAPACMLYILAGRLLRRWRPLVPAPWATGSALLLLSVFAMTQGVDRVNIKAGSFGTFALSALDAAFISAGLLLIAESLFRSGTEELWISRAISRLAACSLPVILGHILFLTLLWRRPWTWGEIAATLVALWSVGLILSRSSTLAKYLL